MTIQNLIATIERTSDIQTIVLCYTEATKDLTLYVYTNNNKNLVCRNLFCINVTYNNVVKWLYENNYRKINNNDTGGVVVSQFSPEENN